MRTALVTGSTDGHGRYVALGLARQGWRVIFHGRSAERAASARAESGEGPHEIAIADLASLAGTRALVDTVADLAGGELELVVCNAGIVSDVRQESTDGAELTFAVNHLAHVLLCEELVRREVGITRIVNVASLGQMAFDWDDPMLEHSYEPFRAYCQSKYAQVCWTFDLAPIWADRGITIDALHPATFMDTTMVRRGGRQPISSVQEGGDATLRLIADRSGTGRFFDGTREARAIAEAYDASERERVHQLTATFLR